VVLERGPLCEVMTAFNGMLKAVFHWYKKLRPDLENEGFELDPFDSCVANKMVNNSQHTIRFHVDDVSHVVPVGKSF